MKTVFILGAWIFINIGIVYSQNTPIFTVNSIWYVHYSNPAFDPSQQVYSIPTVQPDTLINSKLYKKVMYQAALYNSSTGSYDPLTPPVYYGSFRNDSIEKKVFYVFYGDSSEYVIYNFNATIGDTLFDIYSPLEYDTSNYIVSVIDTIDLCSKQIRHFTLNKILSNGLLGFNISWYEGWGGSKGIFTTPSDANLFCCFTLLCFSSNDTVYSPTTCYAGQCQLPTGLENISAELNELKIYPNPSFGVCNIKATSFKKATLLVYDLTGRILLQCPFNSNFHFNTSSLTPGIYLAEVKDTYGKSVKGKLVKE